MTGDQINASTLRIVPTAKEAFDLGPPESWHEVGAPGEPTFQNGWKDNPPELPLSNETVAFYKDHEGIVHLKGFAGSGTVGTIFQLPPGYRPARDQFGAFPVLCTGCGTSSTGELNIIGDTSDPAIAGAVQLPAGTGVSLDGITFRDESPIVVPAAHG